MKDDRLVEERCGIVFEDGVTVGDRIYFPAWNANGLFSVDADWSEVGFEGIFPFEHFYAQRLFGCICHKGNSLFLGPHEGDSFYEFRISDKSLHKMKLPDWLKQERYSFTISFFYKEYVYFAGSLFPGVLKYCPEEERWENIDGWVGEVNENQVYDGPFFVKGACILDGVAYLACAKANYVLAIELDESRWKLIRLGDEGYCYSDICCDGQSIWMAPKVLGQPVIGWHPGEQEQKTYRFPWHRFCGKDIHYFHWRISCAAEHIWLFPVAPGGDVGIAFTVGISMPDGDIHIMDIPVTGERGVSSWLAFKAGERILFSDMKTEKLFVLDAGIKAVKQISLKWNLGEYMRYEGCKMMNANQNNRFENIWKETGKYSLPVLFSEMNGNSLDFLSGEKHTDAGQKIHTAIMKDIG